MITNGQKHLIKCRCILPQFKKVNDPPQHHFVVFSIVECDESDVTISNVKQKFAQCNNCGAIHKVIDICKSEIIPGKESLTSIRGIEEIKPGLPKGLVTILEANHADLATWEAVEFIYENKQWGNIVVLSVDTDEGLRQGKYVRILGESFFKIDTFTSEEHVSVK